MMTPCSAPFLRSFGTRTSGEGWGKPASVTRVSTSPRSSRCRGLRPPLLVRFGLGTHGSKRCDPSGPERVSCPEPDVWVWGGKGSPWRGVSESSAACYTGAGTDRDSSCCRGITAKEVLRVQKRRILAGLMRFRPPRADGFRVLMYHSIRPVGAVSPSPYVIDPEQFSR